MQGYLWNWSPLTASTGGNCGARCCNLPREAELDDEETELLKDVAVREARLTRCGSPDLHTTNVRRGSCACWHKLPMHSLKHLNRRTEEERDDVKHEMEARMREYASK